MPRELLAADRTYYVRTDGDDDNIGFSNSPACAWLTIQHAANWIMGNIDAGGYQVTVKVGPGTYTAGAHVFGPFAAGNPALPAGVVFSGDVTTPSNVLISTTNANCFVASFGARFGVEGFKTTNNRTTGDGIYCSALGQAFITGKMDFGAHGTVSNHMHTAIGGSIVGAVDYTISDGANVHFYADHGGQIEYNSAHVTLTGAPNFSGAFAYGHSSGNVYSNGMTFSGAATGRRYYIDLNGVVDTNGGGEGYFPGNAPGVKASGGQYN